jgi:glutamate carboxypeptidase
MRLATQGRATYAELALPMTGVASGGGTDAAFAALEMRAAVIEGLGLSGFGAHSNDAEFVEIGTIVPRR